MLVAIDRGAIEGQGAMQIPTKQLSLTFLEEGVWVLVDMAAAGGAGACREGAVV